MGAWGPGLRANDVALDAIAVVEDKILESGLPLQQYVAEVGLDDLLELASEQDSELCRCGTLGVAEWLVEHNIDLSDQMIVYKAIVFEKNEKQLARWADPEERLFILDLFESRIEHGLTPEQQRQVDNSNRGLFSRMFKVDPELVRQHSASKGIDHGTAQ